MTDLLVHGACSDVNKHAYVEDAAVHGTTHTSWDMGVEGIVKGHAW